jgi:hypothetical protein
MNSLFYPYIDPVTGLPIIDADIMASLDPNSVRNNPTELQNEMNFNQISMNLSMTMTGGGYPDQYTGEYQDPALAGMEVDTTGHEQQQYTEGEQPQEYIQQDVANNQYNQNSQYGQTEVTTTEGILIFLIIFSLIDSYNMDDYNNPKNYDLYYQSLYQMYPQMSDYVKKQVEFEQNKLENKPQSYNMPCVLFNMGILDPQTQENNLYDPNFISEYYRMNMQQSITQQSGNEIKQEGEEAFDPYNIRSEMGDLSGMNNNEDGQGQVQQMPQQPKQDQPKQEQPIDYSKYDYNKYIEHMYSNQGNKKQKGNTRGGRGDNRGGGDNNRQQQNYKHNYDKNEVNEDVNRFYESFYKEEQDVNTPQNQNQDNNNNNFDQKQDPNQTREHEFEKPMMSSNRRKSRFDDVGPSNPPVKEETSGKFGNFSNIGNKDKKQSDDIKIEPVNENKYYEK